MSRQTPCEASEPTCPVCRTAECRDYYTHKGMELYACKHCATVFLHPPPTVDESVDFYQDSYDGASTGYFAKVDRKLRRSRERLRYLSRYVSAGKFLDIGCNGGFMVEAARERGFEAHGLDLDGVSIAYAGSTIRITTSFTAPSKRSRPTRRNSISSIARK